MPSKKQPSQRLPELLGIFLILITVFLLLSLVTHDPADYSARVYPPNAELHNKAGSIGAAISDFLFLAFGLVAYPVTLLLGLWGFFLIRRRPLGSLPIKLTSVALFIIAAVTLCGLISPIRFSDWALARSMESFGGLTGDLMSSVMTNYFGFWGAFVLSVFVLLMAAVLVTDWIVYEGIMKMGQYLRRFFGVVIGHGSFIVDKIKRYRAKRQLVKQAEQQRLAPMSVGDPKMAATAAPIFEVPVAEPETGTAVAEKEPEVVPPEEESLEAAPPEESAASKSVGAGKKETPVAMLPAPPPVDFKLPPLDLLDNPEATQLSEDDKDVKERIDTIEKTLTNFNIEARVVDVECGPVVTKYEIELGPGISVHRVAGMSDDLAISLKSSNVRIVAPIPGKSTVGIEVPNISKGIVRLKELITAPSSDEKHKYLLPLYLGKDVAGKPLIRDLRSMPHLLIAGTTGAGKSVCVASIILSLLMNRKPDEMKLLLIDPKMVELSVFKDIPHLISPVVTDMRRAPAVLEWLVRTMEERYELFLRVGVKKIETYNQLGESKIRDRLIEDGEIPGDVPTRLPYIVVMIDELADLMMAASDNVETAITRLAQKSRAVGLHLVMATQRPSVDVITGLIKSNMPTRVSFKVASKVDSRTILDRNGAEKLLGKGDMLMLMPPATELHRALCTFIGDTEAKKVVDFLKKQSKPQFDRELVAIETNNDFEDMGKDELFDEAAQIVVETQRGSVSLLQRRLEIGYTRAARLVDMMAKIGVVGEYKGSKAREVMMTPEEWAGRKANLKNEPE